MINSLFNESVESRAVVGYEGLYEVTSDGEVYSLNYHGGSRRVKLKAEISRSGYLIVCLRKDGKQKNLSVHRLVAEAFIPNPEGKPDIDHINTIKSDNSVENLRWVTPMENRHNPITEVAVMRAFQKLVQDPEWRRKHKEAAQKRSQNPEWRRKNMEAIQKLYQDPEFMRKHNEANIKANAKAVYCVELDNIFESAHDAARQLGLNFSKISACCRGERKTHGGYHFRFA